MPVANYNAGIDELYGIINSAWANSEGIVGYVPEIRWRGVQNPAPEPQDKYWIRPSFQTVNRPQSSFASVGQLRKYTLTGLLYIQVFCPKTVADSVGLGNQLAALLIAAFQVQSPSGAIWFRNAFAKALPENDNNYPILFSVRCVWDEVS